jgi:hypothetical protein
MWVLNNRNGWIRIWNLIIRWNTNWTPAELTQLGNKQQAYEAFSMRWLKRAK